MAGSLLWDAPDQTTDFDTELTDHQNDLVECIEKRGQSGIQSRSDDPIPAQGRGNASIASVAVALGMDLFGS